MSVTPRPGNPSSNRLPLAGIDGAGGPGVTDRVLPQDGGLVALSGRAAPRTAKSCVSSNVPIPFRRSQVTDRWKIVLSSSRVIDPMATDRIVFTISSSSNSANLPLSRRKCNAATKPVRLLPSANGWLRVMK